MTLDKKQNFISKLIGDKAFYKMVFAVAIPILVQNVITNFVNLLDNIMVGKVGTEQMSGVSIANLLLFVFNLAIFGATSGVGIFTAQYYGSKNETGMKHSIRFSMYWGLTLLVVGILVYGASGKALINLYLHDRAAIAALDDRVNGRGQPRTSVREKLEEKKSLLQAQRDKNTAPQKQRAAI